MPLSPWAGPGRWFVVLALGSLLAVSGCGRRGTVTGTVTLNGTKLKGGNVAFYPASGPSIGTTIGTDGTYTAKNVPAGPAKIVVETSSLAPVSRVKVPKYKAPPGAGGGYTPPDRGATEDRFTPIPALYEDKATTPLEYTVKPGEQTFDLPLKK